MTDTTTLGHSEFRELIAAYVAGGLEGRERAAFEAHLAVCAACAAALEEAIRVDRRLEQLFGDTRPPVGLEDRVVQRLREQPVRRRLIIHPAVWRATSGIAAALVLGAVGFVANSMIEQGRLPWQRTPGPVAVADPADAKGGELAFWESQLWRDSATDRDGVSDGFASPTVIADQLAKERISEVRAKLDVTRSLDDREWYKEAENRGLGVNYRSAGNGRAPDGGAVAAAPGQVADKDGKQQAGKDLSHYYALNLNAPQTLQESGAVAAFGKALGGMPITGGGGAPEGARDYGITLNREEPAGRPAALGSVVAGDASGALEKAEAKAAGAKVAAAETETVRFFKLAELSDLAGAPESNAPPDELRKLRTGAEGVVVEFDASTPALGNELAQATGVTQNQSGQSPPPPSNAAKQPAQPQAVQNPVQEAPALANRKIIRNGEMEFEVDGFDSAFMQITKIVTEEGGFVSSTNSEKLPNGKVRGTVALRVPPDRLDTLVLKLRALGDLRTQRITAQDVTKVYYDLESELKAARAMEERLLNIIKSGKGEIKDLLEAEKQLGVYRERIEKLEGEIRYYNNLVSLSMLSITLYERDLKQSGLAAQTEQVNAGIETEDVEKSRADAIKAIEEAKGRIVESNLKKYDAGQLGAMIVADVAPDAAGPLIDRLKQLGRVARLDIERKQTTPTGTAPLPQARVERRDTRFSISLYNLANIAPRQTTNMSMAVANVEETYRSILEAVRGRNGRIVTSSLNRQKPEQTTATISFEVPVADADATLVEIRREREVMVLTVTENPDTNNVTNAKRGFSVQVASLATVPARETEQQVVATRQNVAETFRSMLEELKKAEARILVSQLNQQDPTNVSGQLDFEVVRAREAELRTALGPLADMISRTVTRSSDVENTVDSKVRLQVRLLSIDQLAPRVTQTLGMAVKDVPTAYRDIIATLTEIGSRILTSQLNEQDPQNVTGTLDFDVLRENVERVEKALNAAGVVYSRAVTRSADTQNTVEMKLRIQVSFRNVEQLPPRETARVALETSDVEKSRGELIAASDAAGGRTLQDAQAIASNGEVSSHVVIDVPLSRASEIRQQLRNSGTLRVSETSRDPQAPDGTVGRARFDITLTSPGLIVGRDEGLAATVKNALSTSVKGLLWSLNFILIGLLFVGPWILLLWFLWRVVRRSRSATGAAPATTPAV